VETDFVESVVFVDLSRVLDCSVHIFFNTPSEELFGLNVPVSDGLSLEDMQILSALLFSSKQSYFFSCCLQLNYQLLILLFQFEALFLFISEVFLKLFVFFFDFTVFPSEFCNFCD